MRSGKQTICSDGRFPGPPGPELVRSRTEQSCLQGACAPGAVAPASPALAPVPLVRWPQGSCVSLVPAPGSGHQGRRVRRWPGACSRAQGQGHDQPGVAPLYRLPLSDKTPLRNHAEEGYGSQSQTVHSQNGRTIRQEERSGVHCVCCPALRLWSPSDGPRKTRREVPRAARCPGHCFTLCKPVSYPVQGCAGFGWGRVSFIHSIWCGAMVWICAGNT